MITKILKYTTPLRVLAIILCALSVNWVVVIYKLSAEGIEPGLGGLLPWIYGFLTLLAIFIDFILSNVFELKRQLNLFIQIILVSLFMIWHFSLN